MATFDFIKLPFIVRQFQGKKRQVTHWEGIFTMHHNQDRITIKIIGGTFINQ